MANYVSKFEIDTGNNTVEIELREPDYINAEEYGAIADGVTDCTEAINKAILAAEVHPFKKRVILPHKDTRYVVNGSISLKSGVILDGCGSILYRNDDNDLPLIETSLIAGIGSEISEAVVRNLTITEALNISTKASAIVLYSCFNCIIEKVTIVSWRGVGVYTMNASKCIIRNSRFMSIKGAQAVGLDWDEYDEYYDDIHAYNTVENCYFNFIDLDAVICNDTYSRIINNDMSYCGMDVSSAAGAIGACGIWSFGAQVGDGAFIYGNDIHDCTESGIAMNSANNVQISNNKCYNHKLAGIYTSGSGVSINGNIVYNNGNSTTTLNPTVWRKSGIAILAGASKVTVTGNICFDDRGDAATQTYGIDLLDNISLVVVSGNIMQPSKDGNIASAIASGGSEKVLYAGLNQ